jgi:hypothetical protein
MNMKKVSAICILIFFTVFVNAQVNTKPKLNELNQDQLNLALTKSQKTVTIGKSLTAGGLGLTVVGMSMVIAAGIKSIDDGSDNSNTALAGSYIMILGSCTSLIGIPIWIVGADKRKNIELELVKFKTKGSASINGIGLKIRF